tara:strand:+ start:1854 stop:2048 length:195 start_codon:yes stop_codon:yes gene_type:complete
MSEIKRISNNRHTVSAIHNENTIVVKDSVNGLSLVLNTQEAVSLIAALEQSIDYLADIQGGCNE